LLYFKREKENYTDLQNYIHRISVCIFIQNGWAVAGCTVRLGLGNGGFICTLRELQYEPSSRRITLGIVEKHTYSCDSKKQIGR
jgi:hypothetical protein